jgi:hypothetical protein
MDRLIDVVLCYRAKKEEISNSRPPLDRKCLFLSGVVNLALPLSPLFSFFLLCQFVFQHVSTPLGAPSALVNYVFLNFFKIYRFIYIKIQISEQSEDALVLGWAAIFFIYFF